jgi:hypothetical protein
MVLRAPQNPRLPSTPPPLPRLARLPARTSAHARRPVAFASTAAIVEKECAEMWEKLRAADGAHSEEIEMDSAAVKKASGIRAWALVRGVWAPHPIAASASYY